MSKRNSIHERFKTETVISLFALVAALVSLYFSRQANEIAEKANELSQQQITDQVTVVSIFRGGAVDVLNQQGDRTVGCDIDVFLANLGGAPTQIISLSGLVLLDGVEYQRASSFHSVYASTAHTGFSSDLSPIRGAEIHALSSDGYLGHDISEEFLNLDRRLNFPFQIDSFGSVNITNRVILTADPQFTYRTDIITLESGEQITSFDNNENKSSVSVSVTYTLASGREVTTPPQVCFFIEPQPVSSGE